MRPGVHVGPNLTGKANPRRPSGCLLESHLGTHRDFVDPEGLHRRIPDRVLDHPDADRVREVDDGRRRFLTSGVGHDAHDQQEKDDFSWHGYPFLRTG